MKASLRLAMYCLVLLIPALTQGQKTKVLLLGAFHFDNPGLDVAKFENADIMSAKRQREVQEVVSRLKAFRPDKIFVEVPVARQGKLDSSYERYKNGQGELKATEVQQLGFRLARELGLGGLYAVDYTEADFPFDSLVKSATAAKQYALLEFMKTSIDSIQKNFNESLKTKTVRELLLAQNAGDASWFQVGAYFDFLIAGKEGDHVGSYLTSEWWRRNMIIYENILKRLDGKEKSILVIFGSGHTALLQEMMKYNKHIELVPVDSVL